MHTCYFGNFRNALSSQAKIIVSIRRKPSCLFACKKSTSSLTSFVRYGKEIFLVIWARLATNNKMIVIFDVYLHAKINFILQIFPEILQRYCQLFTLGTLNMRGYSHLKWHYQLVENFDVYLRAKNKLYHSLLFWDITF